MLVDLIQTTTRDGFRLDGIYQSPEIPGRGRLPVDAFCLLHGTGGSFYSSSLFDALAPSLLDLGTGVLRINTRGHDLMSTAATARGGRRQGAAYEVVDDARHDVAAWVDWIRKNVGPRVGLIGHSLGAVKAIYALAREPDLPIALLAAISPPRLSYSRFSSSQRGEEFLALYRQAEGLVQAGQPEALIDVTLPLPFVITAAGYVEKYGPEERYQYLGCLPVLSCPVLVTFGELEVDQNIAFQGAPEEVTALGCPRVTVKTIPAADHFYTASRPAFLHTFLDWLRSQAAPRKNS